MSACGGDIKGDWNVVAACVDQDALDSQAMQVCDTATLKILSPKVSGSISYKADGTFVQAPSVAEGSSEFVLPASCLKQGAVTITCQQIEDEFNKDATSPHTTCTSSNGGCKCTANRILMSMSTGTYTVSGHSVTLTDGKDTQVQDFCIVGSKLYMLPTADSPLPAQLQFNRK
jgi:hypothetical protein